MVAFLFSSFVVVKTLCTDTARTFVKHGSGVLIVGIRVCWVSCDVEQLRGLSQEGRCWTLSNVRMDPAQLVAQLAELRTQNQQLHQALQQVQQQQSQQQSLIQAFSDLPVCCANSVISSVGRSKSSTNQANFGGYERSGESLHR